MPANYQKFFVPMIGAPIAADLMASADLRPGERVLDVACGTGVVTRLAAAGAGQAGRVAGLDLNPGMLAVAKASTPANLRIDWIEADACNMPLEDGAFDVVFCQMGLQFIPDKLAAVSEMRRVLAAGGRALVTVPGPMPGIFDAMAKSIARHLGPEAAAFVDLVFSFHDAGDLKDLFARSGFVDVAAERTTKRILTPPPADFLWQYIWSTPIAASVAHADERVLDALESEFCSLLAGGEEDRAKSFEVGLTTVRAAR